MSLAGSDREKKLPPPCGWVQWKGTNVCMDVHCVCGELTHVDADFLYHVRCCVCGRAYWVNGHVELVPLTPEETEQVEADRGIQASTED
jgi:hypothetical protein